MNNGGQNMGKLSRRFMTLISQNRLISRKEAQTLDHNSRVKLEQEITDSMSEKVCAKPLELPADWKFDDYRNKTRRRKYLIDFLRPLEGKTILDLGCGYHPAPIYFALAGAKRVVACDISPRALEYMSDLAASFDVKHCVSTQLSPAEQLPFDDEEFDRVHGCAVLHHVDLALAGPQIARVLKKGGKAAFTDPLGHNLLLDFARDHLWYSWKHPAKGTDRPLKIRDVERFGKYFDECSYRGFGLFLLLALSLAGRGESSLMRITRRLDDIVLPRVPILQRFCRSVVTCVATKGCDGKVRSDEELVART